MARRKKHTRQEATREEQTAVVRRKKRTRQEATWRMLLEVCRKVGRLKVIEVLEKEHAVYEGWEAAMWADPATYVQARRLQRQCLRQDETLIRLRSMTDEDVEQSLKEGRFNASGRTGGADSEAKQDMADLGRAGGSGPGSSVL